MPANHELGYRVFESHQTLPNIVTNTNLVLSCTFGGSGDDRTCGGEISANWTGTIQCAISDPLNTMGTGPTYFATVVVFGHDIVDGPGSDMSAVATGTPLEIDWPCTPVDNPVSHGPVTATTVSFEWQAGIPAPLTVDGATHTVTWSVGSMSVQVADSNLGPDCDLTCCGSATTQLGDNNIVVASFTGTAWN